MYVVISGCSGGGKSTLINVLERRGYAVTPEPGRRLVQQELAASGTALPWIDPVAFAKRAAQLATEDLSRAISLPPPIFFDRSLVDAASALEEVTGARAPKVPGVGAFYKRVFLPPPWPEIFATDAERRLGYDAAVAEYDRLCSTYPSLGYEVQTLPFASPDERADFVLARLKVTQP